MVGAPVIVRRAGVLAAAWVLALELRVEPAADSATVFWWRRVPDAGAGHVIDSMRGVIVGFGRRNQ